jgi:HK97 family phage major capsid protein
MTGSSTGGDGIFTAIDASASREVIVTTSGSLSPVDAMTAWNALGELYRSRASWFSSVSVESKFRNAGANNISLFTIDLTAEGLSRLAGRPYYITDYAPAFTGTTGTVNLAVVGDFQHYVIVQRAGMSVELVPHLVDVTSNRPTGQRGWYAWARNGVDSVNDAAFTLLKNAT